jgi:hypothetical protein
MSDATETQQLATAVAAERFGTTPPTEEQTRRLHIIAALHSVAAFFADHPELPVPRTVQLHCPVETLPELEAVANAFGSTIYGDRPQVSVGIDPPGLYATALAFVRGVDRPL